MAGDSGSRSALAVLRVSPARLAGVTAGIIAQPLALILAIRLSRGWAGPLLAWSGVIEVAALAAYIVCRLVPQTGRMRGSFGGGLPIGWTISLAPCVVGVIFLAYAFGIGHAAG